LFVRPDKSVQVASSQAGEERPETYPIVHIQKAVFLEQIVIPRLNYAGILFS
jgi:hypothetical protein